MIYKVTEELRAAMEGLLEPEEVEEALGQAEVKQTFKASRVGTIAGCLVTDGKVTRTASVRLVRDGTIVWTRQGRLAAALQGRRARRSTRAWSAASCSRASPTSRRATSSSSSRPGRSSRPWSRPPALASARDRVRRADRDSSSLRRGSGPEGQAQAPQVAEGRDPPALRRVGRRDRRATTSGSARRCSARWSATADVSDRADGLVRFVESRCPDGCSFERDLLSLRDIRD